MVMMSPQTMTTNSAPAASRTSRMLIEVPGRRAAQLRVGRERVLRLGHADRVVAVAGFLQLLDLVAHLVVGRDVGGAVDLGGDGCRSCPTAARCPRRRTLKSARRASRPARPPRAPGPRRPRRLRPSGRASDHRHARGAPCAPAAARSRPSVSAVKWLIDTTHGRPKACGCCRCAARGSRRPCRAPRGSPCSSVLDVDAAVVLQRADGGHDHHRVGLQARLAALDVEELLGAQVGAEAGLGHHVVGQLQRRLRGDDGVAAVGDVGERAAVDERRVVLQRLHQVRLERVLQQHGHRAVGLQVARAGSASGRGCSRR